MTKAKKAFEMWQKNGGILQVFNLLITKDLQGKKRMK